MARPDSAANPAGTSSTCKEREIDAQGGRRGGHGGYTVRLSSGVDSFGYRDNDHIAGGNNNDDDDNVCNNHNEGYKQCGGNETVGGDSCGGNETVDGGNENVGGNGANDEYDRGGYKRGGNETVGVEIETVGDGNDETVGRNETVGGGNETVGQAGSGCGRGEEEGWRYTSTTLMSADGAENRSETAAGSENAPPESEPAPVATAKGKSEAGVPHTKMAAFVREGEREGLSGGGKFSLEMRNNSTRFAAARGDEEGGTGFPVLREEGEVVRGNWRAFQSGFHR